MTDLNQAWNTSESIEAAAAAMKAQAQAHAAEVKAQSKKKPPAPVEATVPAPVKAKRGRKPGPRVVAASGPVDSIRSAIAQHKAEIARLKGALKMLRGAA